MGGKVYLRTDRFEVKLEGITFKPKDFEYLCRMDFLFLDGKIWDRPPVVGIDVMRHPRDPSILLVLLCFGVGCVILRFAAGEPLPAPICRFLSDKRIHFVGFGIPEKREMFPFKELGLKTMKVDVGYLAAKMLKQPKCRKWELPVLARRILGIKRMVGLTDASSPERHVVKSAICRLFITSIIGLGLLNGDDTKLDAASPSRRSSFLKNLNSLGSFAEGLFKSRKKMDKFECEDSEGSVLVQIGDSDDLFSDDFDDQICGGDDDDDDDDTRSSEKMPLKGILKCPSTGLKSCKSVRLEEESSPSALLRRANSKGHNACELRQSENRDVKTALDVVSANISAATFLASVSLTLSALIGAWIANNSNIFQSELIYGDTRPATMSIKYITLLICFLLAFSCFVQSSRSFIHANYLISTPDADIATEYVELAVVRGGDFWSVGLRALYFATALLLWFFGPIPMFATSVTMVALLHYMDSDTAAMKKRSGRRSGELLRRFDERV